MLGFDAIACLPVADYGWGGGVLVEGEPPDRAEFFLDFSWTISHRKDASRTVTHALDFTRTVTHRLDA